MDNSVINNCGTGYGPNNICARCGRPFTYVGDVPAGGFAKGCEPFCTCDNSVIMRTFDEEVSKLVPDLSRFGIIPETLKNKIYQIAYIIPKTHPDKKLDDLYDEIIEDISNLLRRK